MFYTIAFIAGFALLVASFLGGIDHDVSHDIGHDVGGDTMSPSFFSLKVISCFLIGFGLGGTVSDAWIVAGNVGLLATVVSAAFAMVGGLFVGFLGWLIIKMILSQQGSTNYGPQDFMGAFGKMTLGIVGRDSVKLQTLGVALCEVKGALRSIDVVSVDGNGIPTGAMVEIVAINGNVGVAKVRASAEPKE